MDQPTMTFRDVALARIHCTTNNDCADCVLNGRCSESDMSGNLNWWLGYILDKLDNAGKNIQDISSEEWVKILEGV